MAIRFSESDAREMGRVAQGVRGIRLSDDDTVVGLVVARRGGSLLTATELGMGKRSDVDDYRIQKRGGKGLINLKPTEKSGLVAAVREVTDDDELMFVTRNGVINRQPAEGIRVIGRNTQGVRLVSLDEGDELVDVASLIDPIGADESENDELETEGAGGADAGATAEIEDAE
jgi:DNA gyrase subunit A